MNAVAFRKTDKCAETSSWPARAPASIAKHQPQSVASRTLALMPPRDAFIQRKCGRGGPSAGIGNMEEAPAFAAIGTKLAISAPSDPSEREADQIADRVMRMSDERGRAAYAPLSVRWPCSECNKKLLAKPQSASPDLALPSVVDVLREPGEPLDAATRAFFEPRFGRDLSQVRIHADSKAGESARAIDALAFSSGTDIVFAPGRYEPNNASGKHLLAHELAHTAQRDSHSTVRRVIRSNPAAPLAGYLGSEGIPGVATAGNAYSAGRHGAANAEQEVLVDMLASPRVFDVDGGSTEEAVKSLSAHVATRLGIVAFAAQKKYSFASVTGFQMNPLYYDIFPNKRTWRLKSGVDKQTAWQDLNIHPELYAIGCAAATELTQAGGSHGASFRNMPSEDENDWISGDAGYVKNKAFPPGAGIGLLGENIIYVGSRQFWGHFSGTLTYRTLAQWKAEVARWHGGGAPGASEVDSKREIPLTGLL